MYYNNDGDDTMSFFPIPQVRQTAAFVYTNWTLAPSSSSAGPSRFRMAARLAADSQFDCPAEELAGIVAPAAEIFRRVAEFDRG